MAYEIWEQNFDAKRLLFIGVEPKGVKLLDSLEKKMAKINCPIPRVYNRFLVDKKNPKLHEEIVNEVGSFQDGDVVILVDDVLYTGRTLTHAMLPFVVHGFRKVQIAVLVFRDYLNFPVKPDYVGMDLASTSQQHVEVVFDKNGLEAYLD